MQAFVVVELSNGEQARLHPGDLIGRSHRADLHLNDARVSEAHAFVSLRAGQLKLLPLRGVLVTNGVRCSEVLLDPGVAIGLARGLAMVVKEVHLPTSQLAIEGAGMSRQLLGRSTISLMASPELTLRVGYVHDAEAHLWSDGESIWLGMGDAAPVKLHSGFTFDVAGQELRVVSMPLDAVGHSTVDAGRLHPRLRIVVSFDTATIYRENWPPCVLGGFPARILSELVIVDGPVHWGPLAKEIWRDVEEEHHLRRRWDRNVKRLRAKLAEAGVRRDLVHSSAGTYEILVYDGDELVNNT